jgi:predicted ABC-type ATPase
MQVGFFFAIKSFKARLVPVSSQVAAPFNNGVLSMEAAPRIIIIAGPNGAGKTTFAREFLPSEAECPVFVNADLIAAGLAPFAPETAALQAGRLMLNELARHSTARNSFAFETTLSGRGYLRQISEWQKAGYRVKLIFLQLASAEEAIARVAQRVRQGGHHIPESVIRRRFTAGKYNFEKFYAPIVDAWALYDNAGTVPELIDWSERP